MKLHLLRSSAGRSKRMWCGKETPPLRPAFVASQREARWKASARGPCHSRVGGIHSGGVRNGELTRKPARRIVQRTVGAEEGPSP